MKFVIQVGKLMFKETWKAKMNAGKYELVPVA